MSSLSQQLHQTLTSVLEKIVPAEFHPVDPLLRPASDEKFGDYQSNAAMGLAKKLKTNPRELAQKIVNELNAPELIQKCEIAGPGFINITLANQAFAGVLQNQFQSDRAGVDKNPHPKRTVIDFSSPNLAKEMHVGHLRTTITGEVLSRVIEFMGHPLERINHVGDWGTQFGMLLNYIYKNEPQVVENPDQFEVKDLESFYKAAKKAFDESEDFQNEARAKVVLLQSGDEQALKLWKAFLRESLRHCHEIYDLLDVSLKDLGESFYNDKLADGVNELLDNGIAVKDDGAACVFLDGYQNRDGEPLPFIIQKKDGGFNYASTDIAAVRYRINEQKADRIVYVTDIRQAQHFAMLFALAEKAGWAKEVELKHIGYGMVLGEDRKPFKTRSGTTVRLRDLIDESVERAKKMFTENRSEAQIKRVSEFSEDKKNDIAQAVGIAALKYADLSHNLSSDYVFQWDKMLAMEGNTGPYMMYAYARVQSIFRKSGVDVQSLAESQIHLEHKTERNLAKVLSQFEDVITEVEKTLKPNLLTDYLYQLAKSFSSFYDKNQGVKVLNAETTDLKNSRLKLAALTAKVLKLGLNLLSIQTVEEM